MLRINIVLGLVCFLLSSPVLAQGSKEAESTVEDSQAEQPVLIPPKLLTYAQATYPQEAVKAGLEAEVVARLDVDETGLVVGVTIEEPVGHGFDEAAEEAMYRFVFEPATRDGLPISSRVLYRYTFFLKEEEVSPEQAPKPIANLSGQVTDMNGKPVPDASVVLTAIASQTSDSAEKAEQIETTEETVEPGVVNAEGKFTFPSIPPGDYQVDIVAAGYKPFSSLEKLVDGEVREVLYRLEVEKVLYEAVVRARRPPREVTRREITRREITRIPGTGGDALRSIQNLPGMARASFMGGELIIRGSSPQDSRYYFDQVPVPMLYHFGGLTSIINSDLLERIDYFPGNYGVRYGGATGGIVEVYPRAPATDRLHAYLDADFWDVSALVETPLTKDWSIAVSGRRSYIDAIINGVMPDDGGFSFNVAPRYYDYQAVIDYHPSKKNNLRLFAFGSDDKLVFVMGDDVGDNPNFTGGGAFAIYFHQAQIRWDHHFSKAVSNSFNIGSGYVVADMSFGDMFKFKDTDVPVYIRDELEYDAHKLVALRTGVDTEIVWSKWNIRAPNMIPTEGEEMDPLTSDMEMLETTGSETNYRLAWYGEFELRPVKDFRLINGLRVDYFGLLQKVGLDPRFVARYEVVEGTTLKGGVGLFHQMPQPNEIDEAFGNPDLDLISAIHYSIGVEQKIIENLEIGLEGFYKDISNLVVSPEMDAQPNGAAPEEPMYTNDGRGEVYGLELMLKHYPTDRLFGWVSYTLMRSRRVDHPGERERRFDYDQTHILTVVASVVLGRGWEAGVRFRLVSGNPETPIIGAIYEGDSDIYFPLYGESNSTRLPMFHQMDIRLDKKWEWKYMKLAVYIDVQNIYNQQNVEGYDYNYDFQQRQYFYGLPVIPSFGFKLEY